MPALPLLAALLALPSALAHNPLLATFDLRPEGDAWTLHGSFSEAGAEAALRAAHPREIVPGLPAARMEELLTAELQTAIAVTADGQPAPLSVTRIDIGPHQTDVTLRLDAPPGAARWQIRLAAFSANPGQTNLLRVHTGSPAQTTDHRERRTLQADNSFTAAIDLPQPRTVPAWMIGMLPVSLLACVGLIRGHAASILHYKLG